MISAKITFSMLVALSLFASANAELINQHHRTMVVEEMAIILPKSGGWQRFLPLVERWTIGKLGGD